MPNKLIDLTGQTFGELTVLHLSDRRTKRGEPLWVCRCSCGAVKDMSRNTLVTYHAKSCGACKRNTAPLFVRTHKNRLYHTWSEMCRRCKGNVTNGHYYREKGITCCAEWENFDVFAQWAIDNGYKEDLEIDRIDGDKGYSPENCRWVTHKMNSRNRKARANNTTGVAGVHQRINRTGSVSYRATIATDDGKINLGTFHTIEEAAAARREAELKYWGFNIGE